MIEVYESLREWLIWHVQDMILLYMLEKKMDLKAERYYHELGFV